MSHDPFKRPLEDWNEEEPRLGNAVMVLLCSAFAVAFWLFITALLSGCATHSPNLPLPSAPSPGPNGQHSGVYAVIYAANGSIKAQVWYAQTRTEYNALIAKFGTQFIPALQPDDHLTPDGAYWKADGTAIDNYVALLNLKRKSQTP
jgi:hypothetical protein